MPALGPGPRVLLAMLVALLVAAAAASLLAPRRAQPGDAGAAPRTLSAIVARGEAQPGYWALPVAPQGTPPERFSDLEASLAPEACGQCHPSQLAGWQTSLHARAMSPGLMGQLVDLLEHDPGSGLECLTCHAPLAEQRPLAAQADGRLAANPLFREPLLHSGITCAACHVRGYRRFGPPALPDNPNARYAPGLPDHGGATRSAAFERGEFCAVCHQFDPSAGINGKPLQNTYEEWRASDWGQRGVACQVCHMPGRQHLWRGIHDPDMVRRALIGDLVLDETSDPRRVRARLRVTNQGAGHHVPTYVTPTIVLRLVQVNRVGHPLPGTEHEARLRRDVAFEDGRWVERSDTRLPAGATRVVDYAAPRHQAAVALRASVDVWPDDFYVREVYPVLLAPGGASDGARPLIERARDAGLANRFTAWTTTVPLAVRP